MASTEEECLESGMLDDEVKENFDLNLSNHFHDSPWIRFHFSRQKP